jgi:hypothetical protein
MMKWMKIIIGLLCVIVGTLPTHVMYAMSEDRNLCNPSLFAMMLLAAVISFTTFAACRILFSAKGKRLLIGVIASYAAMFILLVVATGITGDIAETMMWMPIILLFGIPYMTPLIGMSWLGSVLVFGNGKENAPMNASMPQSSH